MKLKSNELIGLNHWDALGESIVSIVTKITANNYLSWPEMKTLFLQSPKQSQLAYSTKDAGNDHGIDLESIESLFTSKSDIKKSFCDFYFPKWICNSHSQKPLYEWLLRVCPECLKIGKHLCIHQAKFFSYCPIHNTKLRYSCPKCSSFLLGTFEIKGNETEPEFHNSFKCSGCGSENLILKEVPQNELKRFHQKLTSFLRTYESWLNAINTEYSNRTWINIQGNHNSIQIALELSGNPQVVAKKLHYRPIYTSGKVNFNIGRLAEPNHSYELLRYKQSIFKQILKEILLFSNEQLCNIKKRFGITRKHYSTACLYRTYPDNFWGEYCSIWAQAFAEVNYAVNYKYMRSAYLNEEISAYYWLSRMWFSHFAEPLLNRLDITDETNQKVVMQLSKIWIRKFIIQLLLDEVYRLSKALIGHRQKNYSFLIERTGEFEPFYSLVVSFSFDTDVNEVQFWHKWDKFSLFMALYESGFTGYTPNVKESYLYYKKLHQLFRLQGHPLKKAEYLEMLSSQSFTEVGSQYYL